MKKMLCLLLAAALLLCCTAAPAEEADAVQTEESAAIAYVLITVGEEYRWFALPKDEPYSITVKQTDPETGEELVNTITITSNGVYMAESTCDNQDCVDMGEVTLENKAVRILGNMIVCLPHQIMLELYTADEVLSLYGAGERAQ